MLKPFFKYYGSKYNLSACYPSPKHSTIIEPFAGSAAYSLRYPHKDIILCDLNEDICSLWDYLINVRAKEISNLPLLGLNDHIDDFKICKEAKLLIGFWLRYATAAPNVTMSPTVFKYQNKYPSMCYGWSSATKQRIINQLDHIRHWKVINCHYEDLKNTQCTWFIDPPYQEKGYKYTHNKIDYHHLGSWSQQRKGQVIVCEQYGADWLPFKPFKKLKNNKNKKTTEAIYTQNCDMQLSLLVV